MFAIASFPNFVATPQPILDAFELAVAALSEASATVVDLDAVGVNLFANGAGSGELSVLLYDFKNDVAAYFATRIGVPVAGGTLQTAIDYNNADPDTEMPFFNQDIFDLANSLTTTDPNGAQDPSLFGGTTYNQVLDLDQQLGIDLDNSLTTYHLDAMVTATDNPAWATDLLYGDHFLFGTSGLAAPQGYPIVQVPAAMPQQCASPTKPNNCSQYGVPLGISFFGTASAKAR